MSLLGKILACLNILGVAGFICLAAMTFGKQKSWQYADFRHELVISGLPIDDKETDKHGVPIVEKLTEPTLQEMFTAGPQVKTQVEEVKRVRQVFQKGLDDAKGDKREQRKLYARFLLPLAGSEDEREILLAIQQNMADKDKAEALKKELEDAVRPALEIMKADPKKVSFEEAYVEAVRLQHKDPKDGFPEAVLRALKRGGKKFDEALDQALAQPAAGKPFMDLFAAAYDEAIESIRAGMQQKFEDLFLEASEGKRRVKGGAVQAVLTPAEQKRAVAHLLFNLIEVLPGQEGSQPQKGNPLDGPAYRRLYTVVGVQIIGKEIEAQAMALRAMAEDLNVAIGREQNAFALAHLKQIERIKERAEYLEKQNLLLAQRKESADEKEKIVAWRKDDVNYFTEELKVTRKDASARMKELQEMTRELYKIRIQTRDTTKRNQEYEKQINSLEERVR